jgi:hypothetical protein
MIAGETICGGKSPTGSIENGALRSHATRLGQVFKVPVFERGYSPTIKSNLSISRAIFENRVHRNVAGLRMLINPDPMVNLH